MSEITLKAILSGDASTFNSAVASAAEMVGKWRDATAQAAEVGKRFEESLNSQGISIEEWAKAAQHAAEEGQNAHSVTGALADVLEHFGSVGKEAADILNAMGDAMGGAALAAGFLTQSIGELGKFGNEMVNLSAKTGISVEALAVWKETAAVTGVSAEQVGTSIDRLAARVEMGNKQAAAGLAALGLSTQQFMALNPEERFQAIVEGLTGIEDASHKAAVATELLGRGGLTMLPALTEEAANYRHELEAITNNTEASAQMGKEWTEATNALSVAWDQVKMATGAWLMMIAKPEAFTGLDKAATDFEKSHPWLWNLGEVAGRAVGGAIGVKTDLQVEEQSKGWMPKLNSATAGSVAEGVDLTGGGEGGLPNMGGKGMLTLLNDQLEENKKQTADWAKDQREKTKEAAEAWKIFEYQMGLINQEGVETDKAVAAEKKDEAKVSMQMETDFAKSLVAGFKEDDDAARDMYKRREEYEKGFGEVAQTWAQLQRQGAADFAADWSQNLQAVKGLFEDFGVSADSVLAGIFDSMSQGLDILSKSIKQGYVDIKDLISAAGSIFSTGKNKGSGAGALSGGLEGAEIGMAFGPEGAAIGAGAGALIGAIGGLFHHETEAEKIGDDLGHKYSDALAKAIADTESKDHVGRSVAELLHIDDMLKESGADPSTMSTQINSLMEGVASKSVPAAEGVSELGKAFTDLQTAAAGGSVASEAAMVKMIQRAHELGLSIPELDAAVGKMLDDASAGLKQFYGGLTAGGGGKAQGAASQQLFGALYQAQAQTGLSDAYNKFHELFDEMKKSMAPGTKLTGGAAEFALLEKLMQNKEFSGAAAGAEGLAKATTGLMDSGNLSQRVIDAVGKSIETLYDQALHGAQGAGLKGAKADDAALKAVLPELVALQRAQALGAKLTPQETEMLAQAQAKHLLPMLDVQTQQLLTQKQIERNTEGGGFGRVSGGGGYGGTVHAASGFYSPSMPSGPLSGGGTPMVVHPGERVSVTPAGQASGGGRSGAHISQAVNINAGVIVGNPQDIVSMVTAALRSRDPELVAAVQLVTLHG